MEHLRVQEIIRREAKKRKLTVADIARLLRLSYPSAHGMLRRQTLQVQRLAELSEVLQYNFFRELAQKLPYAEPDLTDSTELEASKAEIARLEKRVFELEIENRTLKEAFRDAMAR